MRRLLPVLGSLLLGGLAGCTAPPDLDARVSEAVRRGPFPRLVPTAEILAAAGPAAAPDAALDAPALARSEALRQRAAALSGPVIDPGTRARLEAAGTAR